jgi:hypothetical protein
MCSLLLETALDHCCRNYCHGLRVAPCNQESLAVLTCFSAEDELKFSALVHFSLFCGFSYLFAFLCIFTFF